MSAPATLFASAIGAAAVTHTDSGPLQGRHMPVVTPGNVAECVEVVRVAARERIALYVRGGGSEPRTAQHEGPAALLCTTRLDQVIDHARDDLTFTAEAGLGLTAAQALLRTHGQRLPLSSRHAASTLGGILTRDAEGWTRKSCGMVRDQILGCTVVLGDGRVITEGSRLVKNVSGYNLTRLFGGARAAFGVVLSLTVRLKAQPQARRVSWHGAANPAAAFALAAQLHASIADAEVVRVRIEHSTTGQKCAVVLSLAGAKARVDEACAQADTLAGAPTLLPAAALQEGGMPQCVIEVRPADTLAATQALLAQAQNGSIDADIATGTVELLAPSAPIWTSAALQTLDSRLRGLEALVTFPANPDAANLQRNCCATPNPQVHSLLRGMAQRFDPSGILEPGMHSWK